jgi:hypothetical protein
LVDARAWAQAVSDLRFDPFEYTEYQRWKLFYDLSDGDEEDVTDDEHCTDDGEDQFDSRQAASRF